VVVSGMGREKIVDGTESWAEGRSELTGKNVRGDTMGKVEEGGGEARVPVKRPHRNRY